MIEQFNTEIEDGSTRLIAEEIIRLFQLIAKGDMESVDQWMNKIRHMKPAKVVREAGQDDDDNNNVSPAEEEDDDETMDHDRKNEVDESSDDMEDIDEKI